MGDQGLGKTRWRWFALPFLPAMGAVVVLLVLMASGALAFQISGVPFVLHANTLAGNNFVQYAEPDSILSAFADPFIDNSLSANTQSAVVNNYAADTVTKFDSAEIDGLVQTVCVPISGITALTGKDLLVVIKGTAFAPNGLTAWAPGLTAQNAAFNNMKIGEFSASNLPYSAFTQHADNATITNVTQLGLGTSAGLFQLTGLNSYAAFIDSGSTLANGAVCP